MEVCDYFEDYCIIISNSIVDGGKSSETKYGATKAS